MYLDFKLLTSKTFEGIALGSGKLGWIFSFFWFVATLDSTMDLKGFGSDLI